jgi:hypothetical protein
LFTSTPISLTVVQAQMSCEANQVRPEEPSLQRFI